MYGLPTTDTAAATQPQYPVPVYPVLGTKDQNSPGEKKPNSMQYGCWRVC